MATEQINGAVAATAAAAVKTEPAGGITTDELARNLAQARQADGNETPEAQAERLKLEGQADPGASTDDLPTSVGANGEATEAEKPEAKLAAGFQTLGLSAEQITAVTAALAKGGGELDPEALKLTPEQVTGLEALLSNAPAEAKAADTEEEIDLTHVPKLSPEQAKHVGNLFRDRIGKAKAKYLGEAEARARTETAARETAEAEREQLKQQLAEARTAVVPAAATPLAEVTTPAELQKAIHNAQSVKAWARQNLARVNRNPDSVAAALKQAGVALAEFTPEAMEDWLNEAADRAENTLTVDAPARKEYLASEANFNVTAETRFPQLKDPKSEFYADAQAVLKLMPELKRLPHWKLALGVYARGLAAVRAEDAAAGKPAAATIKFKPRSTPAKITIRPGSAGRRTTEAETTATEAEAKFKSTGTVGALAEMFASQRQA